MTTADSAPDGRLVERVRARARGSALTPVWLLVALLITVTAGLSLLAQLPARTAIGPYTIPWWLVAAGYAAAEVFVVYLPFRRDTQSFSLSEVPFVVGLFFLAPTDLLLALVIGAGAAFAMHRHQSPQKLAFNVSAQAFSCVVGILVFGQIAQLGDPLGPVGWVAAAAAAMTSDVITVVLIAVVVRLATGVRVEVISVAAIGALAAFFNACLGLVMVTVLAFRPEAGWLPLALAVLMVASYRLYGNVREQTQSMSVLHDATRQLHQSDDLDGVVSTTLAQARELFRSDVAELLMFASDGEDAWLARLVPGTDGCVTRESVRLDPGEGVWARIAAEATGIVVPRPITNERLAAYFAGRGVRDLVVAPLFDADRVVGTISVANKVGPVTFDADDLRLLQTFANHASSSLQNARLIDSLRRAAEDSRYMAQHDALTGLPNRRMFRERIDALSDGPGENMFAVALMDINHFKDINDTLGHANGDLLLQAVAERLVGAIGADSVARVGGDEFALLFVGVTDDDSAGQAARALETALLEPFRVGGLSLEIETSMGVALYPRHGATFDPLFQHADVAMYEAKARFAGHSLYDAVTDPYDPDRLRLIGELRDAVEAGQLSVMYQPQVDVRDGRIVGAEALVRWFNPIRGAIPPDQFIPIAEHTSLLKPLTSFVLRTAIAQAARWRAAGHEISISCNLSIRNLLDTQLPDEVDELLRSTGLPAKSLSLELTESALIADPVRSMSVLLRLSGLGVDISIDDYGTGYSSLAYLRRMPVSEIKLDKSFVMGMDNDESDALVVASTLELGHRLGLRVVAEGVETAEAWRHLAELGCDRAQGYYFGQAQTAVAFGHRLARQARSASKSTTRPAERRGRVTQLHASS